MRYKIVYEVWPDGFTCYYRKWFKWHYISDHNTIGAARAACAWHAMAENMKRKAWTYEVFTL